MDEAEILRFTTKAAIAEGEFEEKGRRPAPYQLGATPQDQWANRIEG